MNREAASAQVLPDGTALHEYCIKQTLGQGGFGITYLAHDDNLDTLVAIKEYFPEGRVYRDQETMRVETTSRQTRQPFEQGLKRFTREARTLATFKHPNIVSVLRYFEANNTAYIVLEYEQGQSLEAYLELRGTLDNDEMDTIFLPILDGLREVHAHKLLHLDIKPGNIFLREKGTPLLLDFGGARLHRRSNQSHSSMVQADGYSPPEQYSTRPNQGPWSDIYATAATMYHGMFGFAPVNALDRNQSLEDDNIDPVIPARDKGKGSFPEPFLDAVDQGLGLPRKQRPQTVEAFQHLLTARDLPDNSDKRNQESDDTKAEDNSATGKDIAQFYRDNFAELRKPLLMVIIAIVLLLGARQWWQYESAQRELEATRRQAQDNGAWLLARQTGTAQAALDYLMNCETTGCLHRTEADALWKREKKRLADDKKTQRAQAARQRADKQAFETARKVGTPDALDLYLQQYCASSAMACQYGDAARDLRQAAFDRIAAAKARAEQDKAALALAVAGNTHKTLVDMPPVIFGDTYTYTRTDPSRPENNVTYQLTVNRVNGGVLTASKKNVATGYTRTITYSNEWNVIRSRNQKDKGKDYSPPLAYFDFPLKVGKTWTQESIEKDNRRDTERRHLVKGKVEGWEKVSVIAGEFEGLRVVVDSEVIDKATGERLWRGKDISWYVPQVKRSVKSDLSSVDLKTGKRHHEIIQLVSFHVQ